MVDRVEVFDQNMPLSFSIAYRMMGSVMEALLAEDVTLYSDGGGKTRRSDSGFQKGQPFWKPRMSASQHFSMSAFGLLLKC